VVTKQPPITKRLSMDNSSNDSESSSVNMQETETERKDGANAEEETDESRVYSVATKRDIDSMVQEYKRHKNQFSKPTGLREKRKNPFEKMKSTEEPISEEVQTERKESIMKDSEAHIKVCSEMLLSVFDLLCQLDDVQFEALLPATYPTVCVLVTYANESTLRQTIAEYLQRVSVLYRFVAE